MSEKTKAKGKAKGKGKARQTRQRQRKAKAKAEPLPEIKFDDAVEMGWTFVANIKQNCRELRRAG